jgi:hypothetical protein
MQHLGGDFAQGPQFSIHHHVGLLVARLALYKHLADGRKRIGLLQKRSMTLMLGALVNCFCIGPQAHDQRMPL